ncbi:MAG: hypothetical protein MJY78_05745 [Fibrobacter sp.]|nr:hypothetical protein [Fibrobacter sp.]
MQIIANRKKPPIPKRINFPIPGLDSSTSSWEDSLPQEDATSLDVSQTPEVDACLFAEVHPVIFTQSTIDKRDKRKNLSILSNITIKKFAYHSLHVFFMI